MPCCAGRRFAYHQWQDVGQGTRQLEHDDYHGHRDSRDATNDPAI